MRIGGGNLGINRNQRDSGQLDDAAFDLEARDFMAKMEAKYGFKVKLVPAEQDGPPPAYPDAPDAKPPEYAAPEAAPALAPPTPAAVSPRQALAAQIQKVEEDLARVKSGEAELGLAIHAAGPQAAEAYWEYLRAQNRHAGDPLKHAAPDLNQLSPQVQLLVEQSSRALNLARDLGWPDQQLAVLQAQMRHQFPASAGGQVVFHVGPSDEETKVAPQAASEEMKVPRQAPGAARAAAPAKQKKKKKKEIDNRPPLEKFSQLLLESEDRVRNAFGAFIRKRLDSKPATAKNMWWQSVDDMAAFDREHADVRDLVEQFIKLKPEDRVRPEFTKLIIPQQRRANYDLASTAFFEAELLRANSAQREEFYLFVARQLNGKPCAAGNLEGWWNPPPGNLIIDYFKMLTGDQRAAVAPAKNIDAATQLIKLQEEERLTVKSIDDGQKMHRGHLLRMTTSDSTEWAKFETSHSVQLKNPECNLETLPGLRDLSVGVQVVVRTSHRLLKLKSNQTALEAQITTAGQAMLAPLAADGVAAR